MKYIILFVAVTPFVLYLNAMWILSIPNTKTFIISRFSSICNVLRRQNYPRFAILRKLVENEFTSIYIDYTLKNCDILDAGEFQLKYRPIVGDHIHIGYILSLDGERVILHDRNITEPIPYEHYPATCEAPGDFAYTKVYLHSGVHTHCDGIIHIHPWSAYIPVEGRDVTLGEWFKSVKIEDYNHHNKGYKIRNRFYKLKLAYFENVKQAVPSFTTSNHGEINGLWLKDHHGMVILYTGERPEITQDDIERVMKMEKYPRDYP